MHGLAPLITDLAIILAIAGITMLICQKLRQPLVLGYLLAGIIVGPYTPDYLNVSDTSSIQIVAEFGVIFLMFSLGLEFSFHKLKKIGGSASFIGFVEVILMLVIGYFAGIALGWPRIESVFLGAALSISSTTIIIKALSELQLKQAYFAELVCGVLIIEDLLAILLLVALSTIALSNGGFGSGLLLKAALKLILVVGGWFLIGYFLVPTLFRKWLQQASNEILTVVSVALCLVLVNVAAYFGYSIALGAFIMGSILAETKESSRIETLIHPLRDLFAGVFFVSVGMLINPVQIWAHIGTVLIITLVTIFGKFITSSIGALLSRQHPLTALQVGFSMAQVGEFSFIIAGLGASLGLLSPVFYPIIVAVSVITTFTTPYMIQFSYRSLSIFEKRVPEKVKKESSAQSLHLQTYFTRLILNAIMVAILFISAVHFIWPLLKPWLSFLITYLITAPFLFAMMFTHRLTPNAPIKLMWLFILKAFSFGFTLIILYVLIHKHLADLHERMAVIFAVIVLNLIFKPALTKIYFWFETRLTRNIQGAE